MRMLGKLRRARGVGLLQMTVAVAIMAIMIVAAMPTYRGMRARAYIAEARYHARSWATQAWQQYTERGSWTGVSDETVQWEHPPSRHWQYGPHVYGPEGYPGEAWFVAKLQVSFGSLAYAQFMEDPPAPEPDYMLVVSHGAPWKECGVLLAKSCDRSVGGTPPDPPNLYLESRTSTSITLSWGDVSNEDFYLVEWRQEGTTAWTSGSPLPANTTEYTITSLTCETFYEIRVSAGNSSGSTAGTTRVATLSSLPGVPTGLRVTNETTSSLTLVWNNVTCVNSYYVQWRGDGLSFWTQTPDLPPDTISYTVRNLIAGTTYNLRVIARNSNGTVTSSIITGTTLPSGP